MNFRKSGKSQIICTAFSDVLLFFCLNEIKFCDRTFTHQESSFDLYILFLVELTKIPPSKIVRNRFWVLISKNQVDFGDNVSDERNFTQIWEPVWLEMKLVLRDESRKSISDNFPRCSFILSWKCYISEGKTASQMGECSVTKFFNTDFGYPENVKKAKFVRTRMAKNQKFCFFSFCSASLWAHFWDVLEVLECF